MAIFSRKRSRDAPKRKERRNKAFDDFIRGADLDEAVNVSSGVEVDELRAMQTSAVYACVRVISETVASLPCGLFKNVGENQEPAKEHPLYEVLHDMVNPEMTSFTFREVMMTSLLLYGNAYAKIVRKDGHVKELWYMEPQYVSVERDITTKKLKYHYYDELEDKTHIYRPDQVFHIVGLSYDGMIGISPIDQAREAVGLALATEEYGARFFGNGARPGGVLEHPGIVKDPEKLRESWNSVYQGPRNSNKVAVLEEGMKYHEIGLSPEASQFLETRRYQVNEICRIFRVPPHMIGDLERSTFSNIEHQSIDFVVHTIRPWLKRWEQAIYKCLFSPVERQLYYAHFNVDGLLRGDFATRVQGYATARQNGWMSVNEIRKLENMNPIPADKGGDDYLVNGNMVSAKQQDNLGGINGT